MTGDLTRRAALGLIGVGSVLSISQTESFSQLVAGRGVNVSTTDDQKALVGLQVADYVQRNSREALVEVTNNVGVDLSVTVSLDECTQGVLFGPSGEEEPCTVTFPLPPSGSGTVEIESDVKDTTISFTTSASAQSFSFEAVRQTDAVAGNATSPTADASGPYEVEEGDSVTLDGTNSQGNVKEYDWQIGDGPGSLTDATTATPTYHAPAVDGDTTVTVELTVTNNDGLSDSDEATVTVRDTPEEPPVIDHLTVTKTGSSNRRFQVVADVSDSDDDLSSVVITAVRTKNGNEDYRRTISVTGSTDSVEDTTGQLGNKEKYEIRVEVLDSGGRSSLEIRTGTTG